MFVSKVALTWLLSKPGVSTPILGASTTAHIDDAAGSLDLVLSTK
jgi:aryl-alcohol dehydrogenase-like predicted oxidoreductase